MAKSKVTTFPTRPAPRDEFTLDLFDRRPIHLLDEKDGSGFVLKAFDVTVLGKPDLDQWRVAFEYAVCSEGSSPYWIGKLYNYAEGRREWKDKLQQALAQVGRPLSLKTLSNYGSIVARVGPEALAIAQTPRHAAAVQRLEPAEQREWLERSAVEGWESDELRDELRADRRTVIISGQAALEGRYRVIYADPPWMYDEVPPSGVGAKAHYHGPKRMTIEELCDMPVRPCGMPNAVLHLWTTAPILGENPGPFDVMRAWGFEPKTQRIWEKLDGHNYGHYYTVDHEILLIGTRGLGTPDRPTPRLSSVVRERVDPRHSRKPAIFRADIEKQWDGPYLELFATERIAGWVAYGNDPNLWAEERAKAV